MEKVILSFPPKKINFFVQYDADSQIVVINFPS